MFTRKQKKRFKRIFYLLIGSALLLMAGWKFYQWQLYEKAKATHYPEFGISIPNGYSIHGIDVSKYQRLIAWEEVKKMNIRGIQLGFAFIKATQGAGTTDPQFYRNWKKTKEAGIIRGAYHFFIGSKSGEVQAENFIDKVDLDSGDMPPVLDIEQLNGASPEQLRQEAKKWLNIVELHYGVKPIIYTNVDFYNRNLGSEFDDYRLWAAHYYQPQQPRINRGWVFWQHSDQGRVNGILSKVDFNVFNGDSADFKNLLIY